MKTSSMTYKDMPVSLWDCWEDEEDEIVRFWAVL